MKKLFCILPLLLGVPVLAQDDFSSSSYEDLSSSTFMGLPDSLAEYYETSAKEGFKMGFGLATFFIVSGGGISLFIHLINRGAGR